MRRRGDTVAGVAPTPSDKPDRTDLRWLEDPIADVRDNVAKVHGAIQAVVCLSWNTRIMRGGIASLPEYEEIVSFLELMGEKLAATHTQLHTILDAFTSPTTGQKGR